MYFADVWEFIQSCFNGIVHFFITCYDVLNTSWNDVITLIFNDGWVADLINNLISLLGIDGDLTVLHWLLYFTAPVFIVLAIAKFFTDFSN